MSENCQALILLVDDNETFLDFQKKVLVRKGFSNVVTLCDSRAVSRVMEQQEVAVVVLDLMMPGITGQNLLRQLVAQHPTVPVIILTSKNQLETGIDCMREGACDYLLKPLDCDRFLASINRALELRALNVRVHTLKQARLTERATRSDAFPYIITRNPAMMELLRYVEVIAPSRLPVLIAGETGVGKELFARALHEASRQPGPFIAVNVAGLDDNMFSDTLFGHRKGSYTGAEADREGLVSKAARGTLFLDEIGELAEPAQVKLLRLIQEQEYYHLGSDTPSKSEARVIVATHRDLKVAMLQGSFRKDLYYRLFAHQVAIPPLRGRLDDLALLLDAFISYAARSLGKPAPGYPKELLTLLTNYPFPGNLRELQAMVFEAVARNASQTLGLEQFKLLIKREREGMQADQSGSDAPGSISFNHFPTLKEAETLLIDKALELAQSNQGVAASLLGISRQALNRRLQPLEK
jgi:two-component system, NtrC family, response regulator HydG